MIQIAENSPKKSLAMWNIILLTALSNILAQIIHPIVFILYWTIGFQRYTETDRSKQNQLLAKLKVKHSTSLRDGKPFGIIYGKWYVGYIADGEGEKGDETLDLIINIKRYEELAKPEPVTEEVKKERVPRKVIGCEKKITKYSRSPHCWRRKYPSKESNGGDLAKMLPLPYQRHIIEEMWQIANNYPTNHGAFFLYGEPGTGKSLISDLMACSGPIHYVDCWNPTDVGDFFGVIHSKINPTEEKPLVVLLDEVDKILEKLSVGIKKKTEDIDTQVKGKSEWNKFLSDFTTKGDYPNTILIMASNKTKAYVDGLDTSYMRPGRVDKCWEFTHDKIKSYADGVKEKDE